MIAITFEPSDSQLAIHSLRLHLLNILARNCECMHGQSTSTNILTLKIYPKLLFLFPRHEMMKHDQYAESSCLPATAIPPTINAHRPCLSGFMVTMNDIVSVRWYYVSGDGMNSMLVAQGRAVQCPAPGYV